MFPLPIINYYFTFLAKNQKPQYKRTKEERQELIVMFVCCDCRDPKPQPCWFLPRAPSSGAQGKAGAGDCRSPKACGRWEGWWTRQRAPRRTWATQSFIPGRSSCRPSPSPLPKISEAQSRAPGKKCQVVKLVKERSWGKKTPPNWGCVRCKTSLRNPRGKEASSQGSSPSPALRVEQGLTSRLQVTQLTLVYSSSHRV